MRFDQLLPSPFYRVAIKLIIKDEKDRLLLVRTDESWEMPGGGWEHDESFEDCINREVKEELGVKVNVHSDILFVYRGLNIKNYYALRLAVAAELSSLDVHQTDEAILEIGFFDKDGLSILEMGADEAPIKDFAGQIWPTNDTV